MILLNQYTINRPIHGQQILFRQYYTFAAIRIPIVLGRASGASRVRKSGKLSLKQGKTDRDSFDRGNL